MKVNELIALLSQMPGHADVVVRGYEDGVDDVIAVQVVQIRRDVHEQWYYGRHEIDDQSGIQAVLITGPARPPER